MIRLIQRRLIIPRGDTGTFQIPMLPGKNAGDVSIFTVFDPLSHRKLLEKSMTLENEVLSIQFSHNDTVNLPVGQFVWDIKFYSNPVFADGKLVDGEEIDSYYAAFTLPVCEIRQTGDMMLMVNDAALPPDQLDILLATLNATIAAKDAAASSAAEADTSATNAENSASAAAASLQATQDIETSVLAAQQSASAAASNAASSATAAAASAQLAQQTAQAIHEEIPTKVSDLEDDSGHYTKPANGIPASDLEETYLTEHQDLSNYVQKTDYASRDNAGVVKIIAGSHGLTINNNTGLIKLQPAFSQMIKEPNAYPAAMYDPIVPNIQHESTFYGLAKAAGSDEKNSELPVGQYTDAAKAAIQQMLGVPSTADIPTNISDLTNDAGYLTQHQDISGKANSADLAAVATSGSYEDLSDKPTIPEVPVQDVQVNGTSILENGVAIIPAASYSNGQASLGLVKAYGLGISVDSSGEIAIQKASDGQIKRGSGSWAPVVASNEHLAAFYGLAKAAGDTTQSQSNNAVGTYTDSAKTAIQTMLDVPSNAAMNTAIGTAIGNINSFDMAVVQELPTQDISTHTIYLVPKTGETNDVYDEYVYINNAWEMVGNTQIDLSNYVQKTDYATTNSNQGGIIKVDTLYGLATNNGTISTYRARTDEIKGGLGSYRPIVSGTQHYSTFYGLAKAAGDTTQSQSDNAVGTYTTEAKAAIKTMLGVSDPTVTDVQVNGTSIVADGVANIPVANTNTYGAIMVDSTYGLSMLNGYIRISPANNSDIQAGITNTKTSSVAKQHISTFYGLAKAAGDTTQSQSDNAVGTYTAAAQTAIQNMLGVPSNNIIAIQSAQPTSPDTKIWVDQTEGTTVQVPTVDEMNTADALKANKTDTVLETTLSRGRKDNTTAGGASLAFGVNAEASGYYSVALGLNTTASSQGAYAEGKGTVAHYIAHAEGEDSQALSSWSHAQNLGTIANGGASSASGRHTIANGADSFVFGKYNAEDSYDNWPTWTANTSYKVGDRVKRNLLVQNEPTDVGYHCTVANSDATFDVAHWELDGYHMNYVEIVGNGKEYEDPETHQTVRAGSNAYALEWNGTAHYAGDVYVNANADSSGGVKVATVNDVSIYATKADTVLETTLSRGRKANTTIGEGSFAFGYEVEASGALSYAKGYNTIASGLGAYAEGAYTIASGAYSHAENGATSTNFITESSGQMSHAEGMGTSAVGMAAHSEGRKTQANGRWSHVEGQSTIANGDASHTSGKFNVEDSYSMWQEWTSLTSYQIGDKVKITTVVDNETVVTGYICKIANNDEEFITTNWTKDTYMNYVDIIGNGASNARSNAYALTWTGDGRYAGDVYVGCANDSTGGTKLATVAEVALKLDAAEAGLKVVRLI